MEHDHVSESHAPARTRTIAWEDPLLALEAERTLSGLECLRAFVDGTLPPPPIAVLMGMQLTEASEGRAVFTATPAEYHYNPIGVVHGGLAATLLDSAMGCAVQSTLPAGAAYTTLDINVNFVRPLTCDTGLVTCAGTVVHVGSRTATAEARLTDAAGTLYAHGTTTCIILRR
jgi:uncharacterized protein (TIGR00369 family)